MDEAMSQRCDVVSHLFLAPPWICGWRFKTGKWNVLGEKKGGAKTSGLSLSPKI